MFLFLGAYVSIFPAFEEARKTIRMEEVKGITLPPAIVKLFSLEFRNIAADYLFVRASQFYGGRVDTIADATVEDWQWLYRNIDLVTELDPYFQDPYYMGNAFLAWDAGMVKEANVLLHKATKARYWDWNFPFHLGFNNFYFLGDNKTGAEYLRVASQRPGAWDFLTTLAARLYYMEGKTAVARAFMEKMWENESDPKRKEFYMARLDALNKIFFLEKAVDVYESLTGIPLGELKTLVKTKIIRDIPRDPYGGYFYIDKNGSIRTTSNLVAKPSK